MNDFRNMTFVRMPFGMQAAEERTTAALDNTLQRIAEEQELLELSDAALDDWLPEPVLREYCERVLRDCRKLLTNLDIYKTVLKDDGTAAEAAALHMTS